MGESTSGERRVTWSDPDEDNKGNGGRPISEAEYARRAVSLGAPAPRIVPIGQPWDLMRAGVVVASFCRYQLQILEHSIGKYQVHDGADFLRRRAVIQGPRFEGLSRIMLFRWGSQGERIDINGGCRRRLHSGTADDDAFKSDKNHALLKAELAAVQDADPPWRHWAPLDETLEEPENPWQVSGIVLADFLRSGGWRAERAGTTGNPPGRPVRGATSDDLIRQLIGATARHPLEAMVATLHEGRRSRPEQSLYDELARIACEMVDVNRAALAQALGGCSRSTVHRLLEYGARQLEQNLPKRGEGISMPSSASKKRS